jgi:hypothetical protein
MERCDASARLPLFLFVKFDFCKNDEDACETKRQPIILFNEFEF